MKLFFIGLLSILTTIIYGQKTQVYTFDIDNFWIAYDSVQTTEDTAKQLYFIQTLYLDKATSGLKDFMKIKNHSAKRHLENMISFPKFWTSIRPNTLSIKNNVEDFEKVIQAFKQLYPNFRQVDLFFTIGCMNSGGTVGDGKLLIGAEIATANAKTDASELPPFLQNTFKELNGVLYLVAHEMVHTQQKPDNDSISLLARCIVEGSADFISELISKKQVPTPYMKYGKANEKELWNVFQKEMYGTDLKKWLYNGRNAPNGIADVGYFMGYTICKSYYNNSSDKLKAIAEIIELEYTNEKDVKKFFDKSGYSKKW